MVPNGDSVNGTHLEKSERMERDISEGRHASPSTQPITGLTAKSLINVETPEGRAGGNPLHSGQNTTTAVINQHSGSREI